MEMERDPNKLNVLLKSAQIVPLVSVPGTKNNFFDSQLRFIIFEKLGWDESHSTLCYALKSVHNLADGKLYLRGEWADEKTIIVGEHVNLVCPKQVPDTNEFLVDGQDGFVVVCPDKLISVTSVATSAFCSRKTAFSDRFRIPFQDVAPFRGIVAHELLGRALMKDIKTLPQLKTLLQGIMVSPPIMLEAYGLGLDGKGLMALGNQLIPFVMRFIRKNMEIKAVDTIDIEDNYWNPIYGLKGKLDATVRYTSLDEPVIAPMEFKTGGGTRRKEVTDFTHVGQVQLYTLLMSRRYEDVKNALLLYIKEDDLSCHPVKRPFLKHLMLMRNRLLISEFIEGGRMPNLEVPSVGLNVCNSCDYKTTCSTLIRSNRLTPNATQTEKLLYEFAGSKLSLQEIDFFLKWFSIITLETEAVERKFSVKSLWTSSLDDREKNGKCIAYLQYVGSIPFNPLNRDVDNHRSGAGFNGYLVKFKRENPSNCGLEYFVKVDIQAKDFITLGTHDELCISYATVFDIDVFGSIVTLLMERPISESLTRDENCRYTVDMVSGTSPIMAQYGYLQSLMTSNPRANTLRGYLILKKPITMDYHLYEKEMLATRILNNYNRGQRRFLVRAVQTDSYVCVHGMPGTGKTRTIGGLMHLLRKLGKTVLVTAFTGQAVDNMLLEYSKNRSSITYYYDHNFVRVGQPKLSDEVLKTSSTTFYEQQFDNVDELASAYDKEVIFGSTLLNLKHPIFRRKKFDYVIIDEASQALPSAAFGALLMGSRFVLVGDPKQLPAIVQGNSAGLIQQDDSIFNMLATKENTVELYQQYRMNGPIMRLANELVYNGQMTCTDSHLSEYVLRDDHYPDQWEKYLTAFEGEKLEMLKLIMSDELIRSVIWLDTSKIEAYDSRKDESLFNEQEVMIVEEVVKLMLNGACIAPQTMGIIAPYRAQVQAIKSKLQGMAVNAPYLPESYTLGLESDGLTVDVSTVDQFQGQQKLMIICSFTKNRPVDTANQLEGELADTKGFLQDMRRLNVSITRAKYKLVMIGNLEYLRKKFEPFEKLYPLLDKELQVFQLTEPIV